jgi:GNAT superfamily N-acetyltransferase
MLQKAYWSPGITRAEVVYGAESATVVIGAFANGNEQVGYMRVLSDRGRFAYLMDVFVDEAWRGRGIGRRMVRYAMEHPDLRHVYQWLLRTKDAHGVYARLGFAPLPDPTEWMIVQKPRPDRPTFTP